MSREMLLSFLFQSSPSSHTLNNGRITGRMRRELRLKAEWAWEENREAHQHQQGTEKVL